MNKEIEEIWKEIEEQKKKVDEIESLTYFIKEDLKERKEEIKANREDINIVMKILRTRPVEKIKEEIRRMIKDIEKEMERIEEKETIEDVKMMKIYGLRSQINILNWVLQLIIKYC